MHITFIGTSGSWPTKERNVPAVAVKMGGDVILLDCGEGTQRQFMNSNLSFMSITKVLITHLHGDHFLGLPGLIQTMSLNDRKAPLDVFGPKGIKDFLAPFVKSAYFEPSFEVTIKELGDGDSVKCKIPGNQGQGYTITAFDVEHAVKSIGYSIEEDPRAGKFNLAKAKKLGIPEGPAFAKLQSGQTITITVQDGSAKANKTTKTITPNMVLGKPRPGRKLVYSGDTKPTDNLIKFAKDCDVLIHEATANSELEEKANKYGHTSAKQAATAAKKCGAKQLFITHISPRYADANIIKKEAKSIFKKTTVAEDFLEYEVKMRK